MKLSPMLNAGLSAGAPMPTRGVASAGDPQVLSFVNPQKMAFALIVPSALPQHGQMTDLVVIGSS
jgi:hypothetical protein